MSQKSCPPCRHTPPAMTIFGHSFLPWYKGFFVMLQKLCLRRWDLFRMSPLATIVDSRRYLSCGQDVLLIKHRWDFFRLSQKSCPPCRHTPPAMTKFKALISAYAQGLDIPFPQKFHVYPMFGIYTTLFVVYNKLDEIGAKLIGKY